MKGAFLVVSDVGRVESVDVVGDTDRETALVQQALDCWARERVANLNSKIADESPRQAEVGRTDENNRTFSISFGVPTTSPLRSMPSLT